MPKPNKQQPSAVWKNAQGELVDRFSDWGEDTIEIILPNQKKPVIQKNPKKLPPTKGK